MSVDSIEAAGNVATAMLGQELREGRGDQLATGEAEPARQGVRGLEEFVRERDGGFHTRVLPQAYRGVKLPNQRLQRAGAWATDASLTGGV